MAGRGKPGPVSIDQPDLTPAAAAAPGFKPWFQPPAPLKAGASIAVIGAGIAGAMAAGALVGAGFRVTVFDGAKGPGGGASGNAAALIQPRPSIDGGAYGDFMAASYLHMVRFLDALGNQWLGPRGGLWLATDAAVAGRQRRLLALPALPSEHMVAVDAAAASRRAGIAVPGGLWFPGAGAVAPKVLLARLLDGIDCRFATSVTALDVAGGGWRLQGGEGGVIAETQAVVLAAGPWSRGLAPVDLPMPAKRGQVTLFARTGAAGPARALSGGGYILPAGVGGDGCLGGATVRRWHDLDDGGWRAVTDADHAENRAQLSGAVPALAAALGPAMGGRAGLRCAVADHLPLVGGLPDAAAYVRDFGDLRHGRPPGAYPPATYHRGLYITGAFGSHGFRASSLAAELLADWIAGRRPCLAVNVIEALHPARFLVRDLKRDKAGQSG